MKLIAVYSFSVIPLVSIVWVEGYGEAIAGRGRRAIKGPQKIGCFNAKWCHSPGQWGRKTVKIIVLN